MSATEKLMISLYGKNFRKTVKDETLNSFQNAHEHEQQQKLIGLISLLVIQSKKEYGEYLEEIIGYEKGELIGNEIFWNDEILPLNRLNDNDDFGDPTSEDLTNRKLSNEEYFWYGEHNEYCIAKRVKVLNAGWKTELLNIINKL
jgi:hypothetical protein